VAENEITLDKQEPAKVEKKAEKPKKVKPVKVKPKKETDNIILPVLVEFTVTFSVIFVVLLFFAIVGVSFVTGTTLLDFVVHTSISILVIGGILAIIARQIAFGVLASHTEEEEKEKLDEKVEGKAEEKVDEKSVQKVDEKVEYKAEENWEQSQPNENLEVEILDTAEVK
jgi:hypothetical protein